MDSLSPSTTTFTTTKSLSAVASNPFSSKISQLSTYRTTQTRRVAPKISFSAANNYNGNNHQTPKTTHDQVQYLTKMDRRNVLIGLGGVCGAATIFSGEQPTLADTAVPTVTFPKALDHIIRTNIQRPRKSRSKSEKEDEEEILVINLEVKKDVYSKFDVYVNDEDERPTKEGRAKTEYAGSFVNVPHKHKHGGDQSDLMMKTSLKLGLTDLIEDLGADDDEGIDVIFVPRTGTESLVIKDVRIEFL